VCVSITFGINKKTKENRNYSVSSVSVCTYGQVSFFIILFCFGLGGKVIVRLLIRNIWNEKKKTRQFILPNTRYVSLKELSALSHTQPRHALYNLLCFYFFCRLCTFFCRPLFVVWVYTYKYTHRSVYACVFACLVYRNVMFFFYPRHICMYALYCTPN
jgi:hypothetical protein